MSLQVGPERAQNEDQVYVEDILPKKPTWAETAALIANLDLVITVDTAVAHLAGAMGKPTWLMCQRDGCSCIATGRRRWRSLPAWRSRL